METYNTIIEIKARGLFLLTKMVLVDGELKPRCEWTADETITPRFTSTEQADSYAVTMFKYGSYPKHWYPNIAWCKKL